MNPLANTEFTPPPRKMIQSSLSLVGMMVSDQKEAIFKKMR
jgi:hypothetical protein